MERRNRGAQMGCPVPTWWTGNEWTDGLWPAQVSFCGPTQCVGLGQPCWPATVQGPKVDVLWSRGAPRDILVQAPEPALDRRDLGSGSHDSALSLAHQPLWILRRHVGPLCDGNSLLASLPSFPASQALKEAVPTDSLTHSPRRKALWANLAVPGEEGVGPRPPAAFLPFLEAASEKP